jgi:primosomal protein N'
MGMMKRVDILMHNIKVDGVAYCIFCNYKPLEADYDTCPECGKKNPLKEMGLV